MATSNSYRYITHLKVKNIEKRYRPNRHYVFIVRVLWSDDSQYIIYRSYGEFFDFHTKLLDLFPKEAGTMQYTERLIPLLPGRKLFQRTQVYRVANQRRYDLNEYCLALIALDPYVSQHEHVLDFFMATPSDINPPKDARLKPEKPLEVLATLLPFGLNIAGKSLVGSDSDAPDQINLDQYRVIADFEPDDHSGLALREGDLVDVVEKNQDGWWFVQTDLGQGRAPASYLEGVTPEEQFETEPNYAGEVYITIRAYTAVMDDEISFGESATVDVLHKLLDGWWVISYMDKVGYAPSAYLTPYTHPMLAYVPELDNPSKDERERLIKKANLQRMNSIRVVPPPRRIHVHSNSAKFRTPERNLDIYEKLNRLSKKKKLPEEAQQKIKPTAIQVVPALKLDSSGDEHNVYNDLWEDYPRVNASKTESSGPGNTVVTTNTSSSNSMITQTTTTYTDTRTTVTVSVLNIQASKGVISVSDDSDYSDIEDNDYIIPDGKFDGAYEVIASEQANDDVVYNNDEVRYEPMDGRIEGTDWTFGTPSNNSCKNDSVVPQLSKVVKPLPFLPKSASATALNIKEHPLKTAFALHKITSSPSMDAELVTALQARLERARSIPLEQSDDSPDRRDHSKLRLSQSDGKSAKPVVSVKPKHLILKGSKSLENIAGGSVRSGKNDSKRRTDLQSDSEAGLVEHSHTAIIKKPMLPQPKVQVHPQNHCVIKKPHPPPPNKPPPPPPNKPPFPPSNKPAPSPHPTKKPPPPPHPSNKPSWHTNKLSKTQIEQSVSVWPPSGKVTLKPTPQKPGHKTIENPLPDSEAKESKVALKPSPCLIAKTAATRNQKIRVSEEQQLTKDRSRDHTERLVDEVGLVKPSTLKGKQTFPVK